MRRFLPAFAFSACLAASFGFFFLTEKGAETAFFTSKTASKTAVLPPGGSNEEAGERRKKWDLRRFADPATGQIPAGIGRAERLFAARMPTAAANGRGENWTARGPHNVGGRTRAFAIDVLNENHLFAGGVSGGLWESTDGGATWARRTPMNAHPGVVSIAQDTRAGKTDTWYYLSGEIYGTSASASGAFYLGDGLFKSTDNGATWAAVASTAGGSPASFSTTFQSGWRVVTNPVAATDEVYMALYGGIYRSTNGGANWQNVLGNSTSGPYFSDLAVTSAGVFYATLADDSAKRGIWRSTNGANWVNITPAFWPPLADSAEVNRVVIGINPTDETEVFFLGSTPKLGHYTDFLRSDDWQSLWRYKYVSGDGSGAGGEWQNRSANLPSAGTQLDRFACQGGYDLAVKVQPGTGAVFIAGTNVFRSTDGFSTAANTVKMGGYGLGSDLPFFELWPNHHPDIHDLAFLPSNPNVLFTASDGGVHKTLDASAATTVWQSLNHGYRTTQFYTVMLDETAAGDPTVIGGLQDNGNFWTNSADPEATWRQTVNGDGAFGAILPGGGTALLCRQEGRLVKTQLSPTGEVTAFRRMDPIGPERDDYLFINPFSVDPKDQRRIFWPAGRRLFRQDSLDAIAFSTAWDSISQGWFRFSDTTASDISAIAVARTADRAFVGTAGNQIYRIDGASTTAPVWQKMPSPLGVAAYVSCIAIDPADADDVTVVYSNYSVYSIWRSLDGGDTWARVAGNLETASLGGGSAPSVRWLTILPFADGARRYFCGTSVGLFSADSLKNFVSNQNTGTVWALEGAAVIGNVPVNMIAVRASDGMVAAATHGSGMFTATATTSVGVGEVSQLFSRLFEAKSWPNPTAGELFFEWQSVEKSGSFDLEIFNEKGQTLRRERFSAAAFSARVDVAGLPSGPFFWRLKNGSGQTASGRGVKR